MNEHHIWGMLEVERLTFNSSFAEETFKKELNNKIARYIVAKTDGKITGYGGLWNICGEGDIIDIATHPDYRRMGIADGILKKLIEICKNEGCTILHLEVRKSNTPARLLYKKNGFTECGERPKYYENKETAILMSLKL